MAERSLEDATFMTDFLSPEWKSVVAHLRFSNVMHKGAGTVVRGPVTSHVRTKAKTAEL